MFSTVPEIRTRDGFTIVVSPLSRYERFRNAEGRFYTHRYQVVDGSGAIVHWGCTNSQDNAFRFSHRFIRRRIR